MLLLVMVVVVSSKQAAYEFASTLVNHHAWDGSSNSSVHYEAVG